VAEAAPARVEPPPAGPRDRRQEVAAALVRYCKIIGMPLRAEAGTLRFATPPGRLDPELEALLVQHKPELLALLAAPRAVREAPAEARRGRIR
jgi:hypothetical protein